MRSNVDSAVVAEALALSELLGSSVPMWTRDADVVGDDGRSGGVSLNGTKRPKLKDELLNYPTLLIETTVALLPSNCSNTELLLRNSGTNSFILATILMILSALDAN